MPAHVKHYVLAFIELQIHRHIRTHTALIFQKLQIIYGYIEVFKLFALVLTNPLESIFLK